MIRRILGPIVGYVVMAVVVMVGFVVGPMLLGVDLVLSKGTYNATPLWQWIAVGIGLVGAFAGGLVCRLVARRDIPCYVLIAIAVIPSSVAIIVYPPPPAEPAEPAVRPDGLSVMEALRDSREHAREPLFTRITNPLAAGIGIGLGMLAARRINRHLSRHL